MPRVEQYQSRVGAQPLPSARLNAQEPVSPVGDALAGFGQQVARSGQALADIAIQARQDETRKADQTALLTADRQLDQLTYNLLNAPDRGALENVHGKDALGLHEQVMPQFDEQATMIVSNLNDRQKLAFEPARAKRRQDILNQLAAHTNREMGAYRKGEAEASLDAALNLAAANPEDWPRVAEQLGKVDTIVDAFGVDLGLVGPEAKQAYAAREKSKIHEAVILGLLAQGQDLHAKVYFDQAKDEIVAASRARIEAQVTEGSSAIQGMRTADEVWSAHAPADDKAAIEIDTMEADVRARFPDDKRTRDTAIAELRQRMQGVEAARKQRNDVRDDTIWTSIMQNVPLATVMRSREFVESDGTEKNRVVEYYRRAAEHAESLAASRESRAAARENRDYTRQLREERQLEINGWAKYFELSDPEVLSHLTPADIRKQLPELGPAHVNRLLNDREQMLRSAESVRAVSIDDALFKDIARDAGLGYVDRTPGQQSQTEKANLGSLKAAVLDEIGKRQVKKGGALTFDEKREAMQSIVDHHVMIDNWFTDTSAIAAVVHPNEQQNAYVPIGEIPQANVREAVNYLRSTRPGFQSLTDDQIRARAQRAIERAFAAKVLGLGADEESRRLKEAR